MNFDKSANNIFKIVRNIIVVVFWIFLIVLCFIYKDNITVQNIINFTPENTVMAIVMMLFLFAFKSVTFFIYGGILYAASGIIFSLPVAIFVNCIGSIIMTSIPFFVGKKMGGEAIDKIIKKHPRLSILRDTPSKKELFVSFFVRIVRCLPSDPLSMYLGASGIRYSRYICGTLLGLSPAIVTFSIMGMSINDVNSPAFIISAGIEIGLMILSVSLYLIWRKKNKNKTTAVDTAKTTIGGKNDI